MIENFFTPNVPVPPVFTTEKLIALMMINFLYAFHFWNFLSRSVNYFFDLLHL